MQTLLTCLSPIDYELCGDRNLVYSLLYLHHPVPLAVHRGVQYLFAEGRKREGKKEEREEGRKEGKMWVTNEDSQVQIINKIHYNDCNIS